MMRKCLHCSGTGWDSPPREYRQTCRECHGEGEVPDTHAWAGYVLSLDFCAGGTRCPMNQRATA